MSVGVGRVEGGGGGGIGQMLVRVGRNEGVGLVN